MYRVLVINSIPAELLCDSGHHNIDVFWDFMGRQVAKSNHPWPGLVPKGLHEGDVTGFLVWGSMDDIDGLVQDCTNSSALAMELLQFFTQDCTNSSALAMELLQFCTKPLNSARLH